MVFLLKYYLAFILLSIIYKTIFFALNHGNGCFAFSDYTDVLQHGIRHDFAVAGYFTAIPLLLTMAKTFMRLPLKTFYRIYNRSTQNVRGIIWADQREVKIKRNSINGPMKKKNI